MKFKNSIILVVAVFSFAFAKAQDDMQCRQMLSIYAENAKAKLYDEAYKQLPQLVENCPKLSAAIYQYGERIYEHRLKKKVGAEKENAEGLIKMLDAQITMFPDKVNDAKKTIEKAMAMYKYDIGTHDEVFNILDGVFKNDRENFTDPRGMMTYFKLAEERYNEGKMTLQELFDIYDALTEQIDSLLNERSEVIQKLNEKEAEGELTDKEKKEIKNQEINLKNYGIVKGSVNGTLGALADCDKLIPLYDVEFENKKTDKNWLSNVLVRLQKKDCTDDPLYIKSVKALHDINPSAKTAYGLGNIAESTAEKFKYWDQAIELGVDNDLKSSIHYKKGNVYKSQGAYSKAKREYILSNQAKPSFGMPYLKIAEMIAKSGNNCGSTPIEKRAVNWLAARYARKAAAIDPSIRSTANKYAESYEGTAPGQQDIFMSQKYNSGDTITFNCWVGESVRIP